VLSSQDTLALSEAQRAHYREHGWLAVSSLVDAVWLDRLRAVTDEFVEQSRSLTESNMIFDLDVGHTAAEPRLRRLSSPTDLHETYWSFASTSPIVDVVVDLVGPDVKFHHSKLNFKAARGGEEVKWHQDIQFWPHTNHDLLTVGVFLEDVEPGMGAKSASSRAATTGRSSICTTATSGSARSPTPIFHTRVSSTRPIRPARPARSRYTTAAPCTAPHPTDRNARVRCCSGHTSQPTRIPTPIS
jgi:hypothetical protein